MKKVFLTMALVGTAMFAQAQVQIGPKLGLNMSSVNYGVDEVDGVELDRSMVVGFNIGAAANIKINDMFSFAPELIFTQKGGKKLDSKRVRVM